MPKRINSKNKGSDYERKIRLEMIELGWTECETARYASKKVDDSKVDLCNTVPLNIQCKAMEKTPNLFNVLDEMPKDSNHNVIFHKKNRRGEIVVMRKEDFYELLKQMIAEKIINPK